MEVAFVPSVTHPTIGMAKDPIDSDRFQTVRKTSDECGKARHTGASNTSSVKCSGFPRARIRFEDILRKRLSCRVRLSSRNCGRTDGSKCQSSSK
eukprot:1914856-Prymnesium_polylepis.1